MPDGTASSKDAEPKSAYAAYPDDLRYVQSSVKLGQELRA